MKYTPLAAIESMLGVLAHLFPTALMASTRCWSVVMMSTLGRLLASAANNGAPSANARQPDHRPP